MILKARRIFISHSTKEDQLANRLVEGLTARGLKPFVDHHPKTGIVPGEDWLDALSQNLSKAQSVLIVISAAWRQSQWCQAEYKSAKLMNKTIIPVAIGREGYEDIEPSRQKVILDSGAEQIDDAVLDAIARSLPGRTMAMAGISVVVAPLLMGLAAGIKKAPFGRWDAASIRGGTFPDLTPDPQKDNSLLALAARSWGSPGDWSPPYRVAR